MSLIKGAGELTQRVIFQRQVVKVDEIGNHVDEWEDCYASWASVTTSALKTEEKQEAGQTLENERLDFTVRWCSQTAEITSTGYRIIFKERIYNIDRVDNADFSNRAIKFSAYLVRR